MNKHTFVFSAARKPLGYVIATPNTAPKTDDIVLVQRGSEIRPVLHGAVLYYRTTYPSWLSPEDWMKDHVGWRWLHLSGAVWYWPEAGLRAMANTRKKMRKDEALYIIQVMSKSSGSGAQKIWGQRFRDWLDQPTLPLMSKEERDAFITKALEADASDYMTRIEKGYDLSIDLQL